MPYTPIIRSFPSLSSTMDEARAMAESGAPEFTVVQAEEQTSGRGRFGNAWSSPPGNLYMTIILRPNMPTRVCAQVSFALALALSDTILHAPTQLKWPNDVLVSGKKIAGILLEMAGDGKDVPDFMLAGVGVNIASGPEGSAKLSDFMIDAQVHPFRDQLLENIGHWYERWQEGRFEDIRSAWLARAYGVGQAVKARFADRSVEGVFEGLDSDGNLILREDSGRSRTISSGAIHFGP